MCVSFVILSRQAHRHLTFSFFFLCGTRSSCFAPCCIVIVHPLSRLISSDIFRRSTCIVHSVRVFHTLQPIPALRACRRRDNTGLRPRSMLSKPAASLTMCLHTIFIGLHNFVVLSPPGVGTKKRSHPFNIVPVFLVSSSFPVHFLDLLFPLLRATTVCPLLCRPSCSKCLCYTYTYTDIHIHTLFSSICVIKRRNPLACACLS